MASVRKFLTADQIKRLYLTLVKNALPTQEALLESAVTSPMNIKCYNQQDNVFVLAAELAFKLIKNHAYIDGNKRIALVAADMFLKINGYQLQETVYQGLWQSELVNAHTAVADGRWTVENLATFYHSIATPSDLLSPGVSYYKQHAQEY